MCASKAECVGKSIFTHFAFSKDELGTLYLCVKYGSKITPTYHYIRAKFISVHFVIFDMLFGICTFHLGMQLWLDVYTLFIWAYTFHLGVHFYVGMHFSFGCTLFIGYADLFASPQGVHFHLGMQFSFGYALLISKYSIHILFGCPLFICVCTLGCILLFIWVCTFVCAISYNNCMRFSPAADVTVHEHRLYS